MTHLLVLAIIVMLIFAYAYGEHIGWEAHKKDVEERNRQMAAWERRQPKYIRNYELHDWDEPACVVFSKSPHEPMRWKVMRYGAVLNGFFTEEAARKWLAEKQGVKP